MKRYLICLLTLAGWFAAEGREVIPLNEGWRFYYQSEKSADRARTVTLPHSWNTDPTAGSSFVETTGCYLNTLYVPADWAGERLFVKFYGAQSVADLFVNGRFAGTHSGAATAFVFEITDKVRFGAENDLLVTVSNSVRNDVLPTSTDTNRYGGLYRGVELIRTAPTAVSPLYLGSEGILVHPQAVSAEKASGEVEIHLTARRKEESCLLTLEIADASGKRVFTHRQRVRVDEKPVEVPFAVERPQLWSPAHPALYTVTVSLAGANGEVTDRTSVRTGFRTIEVTPAGGFTINGDRCRAVRPRSRIWMPTCRRSRIWEPMRSGRPSCPMRPTSTTAATKRGCWFGSTCPSTAPF